MLYNEPDPESLPGDYAELFQQVYKELLEVNKEEYINYFAYQNNTNIFENTKLEVLKLILIIQDCENDSFHRKYLVEKLERILNDMPIVLHTNLAKRYEEEKKEFI